MRGKNPASQSPLLLTEELWSLPYTRKSLVPSVYREKRSYLIQGGLGLNLIKAKLGLKTKWTNWTDFRDNNGGMPPVMGTDKSYQHEMLHLLGNALLMVFFRGLGSFSSSP